MTALFMAPFYLIINLYFCFRIIKWLSVCHPIFEKKRIKIITGIIYYFFVLSIGIAFILPRGNIQRIMKLTGNYWLGCLAYIAMTILFADIIGLIVRKFTSYKKQAPSKKVFRIVGAICLVVIVCVSLYGGWNARQIHTTPYDIQVNKKAGKLKKLNVMLVADLHLGYNIGRRQMTQMVKKINATNPDLVVIAGDIFDNEYEALDHPKELASILRGIKSKYGVYAVYGNHDIEEKILAGFTFPTNKKKVSDPRMDQFLADANIKLLRDENVLIDNSFYLYGRPDFERPNRGVTKRKTEKQLMATIEDKSKPVLVIDHEPRDGEKLAAAGVDVALSGHTHDGQLFPGNITINWFWANAYGYKRYDNMHQIVTSGVGLFGPNMRVGTIAEICPIEVTFK